MKNKLSKSEIVSIMFDIYNSYLKLNKKYNSHVPVRELKREALKKVNESSKMFPYLKYTEKDILFVLEDYLVTSGEFCFLKKDIIIKMRDIKQDKRKLPRIKIPKAYGKMTGKSALDWTDILIYDAQMLRLAIRHKDKIDYIKSHIPMLKHDLKRVDELSGKARKK